MKKTKTKLVTFLKKEISTDGSGNDVCRHCGKVTSYGYSWIDHKDSAAGNIAKFLGFGSAISSAIHEVLDDFTWSNADDLDYEMLAQDILEAIYGESHD